MTRRVAVVGAGITGLAAAHALRQAGIEPVVLEASDRPGGKIDNVQAGGLTIDTGPDGFLARDTAVAELCRRLGLGADLVEPAATGAFVWVDGDLRALPARSVLGVPWTADAVRGTGIVSDHAAEVLARGLAETSAPPHGDASVGEVLRPRIGDEVFERLVDPLLGGINAGSADEMSIAACAPALHEAVHRPEPLGPALREVAARQGRGAGGDSSSPVFQSVRGGVTRIIDALVSELGGAVALSQPVQAVDPVRSHGGAGWRVTTTQGAVDADGVILACPAPESARLLEPLAADAAGILAGIEYADVLLAVFVLPADRVARPLEGSGFLVPRSEGLLMTACSWASAKWSHYDSDGLAVLRVSAGRSDDRRWLDLTGDELVATLRRELADTAMVSTCDAAQPPLEVRLARWPRSLPQYRPGHLDRMAEVDACLGAETPGLVAAGAAFGGVGLPACVRGAQTAAAAVARVLHC